MQQAVTEHPEVHAAVNRRLAADAGLRAAQGGYLPKVDVLAGYGREGTDNPSSRAEAGSNDWNTLNRGESNVRLSQMLFDGFATSSEVGRNKATVNSRAYALLNTSERTALTVAQVYLEMLTRQELVRLAQDNLDSHERIHDQIRLRTDRGVGRMADLNQAEARLAQARNNLITEQTNLVDAQTNFYSAVGADAVDLQAPTTGVQLPETLAQARQQMIENSPVLRSAEADIAAAEQQYNAAKSTYYPRFDAELGRSANNDIDGQDGHYNEWEAMVRMRYNLYSGGSDKATLEARSYEAGEALDIRNNALRQLNEELGLAWNALNNARTQLPIAQKYVDETSEVRSAYQKQFALGERTLLDLLDSENELFSAQRRLAEIKLAEQYTQYRLQATLGTLLKTQGVVAPMETVVQNDVKPQIALPGLN
ncbi:channel protein TolC [Pseudomonas turukhanskensis]|uniref:Channel protein TolC n=2 Tax=Pseudomonas turukhanskensis TaxID=1806536 RepID=A0A9W6K4M6_9PSED|nr:channel protein TolC [Pseudomonas turukhanskensis]